MDNIVEDLTVRLSVARTVLPADTETPGADKFGIVLAENPRLHSEHSKW